MSRVIPRNCSSIIILRMIRSIRPGISSLTAVDPLGLAGEEVSLKAPQDNLNTLSVHRQLGATVTRDTRFPCITSSRTTPHWVRH